MFLIWQNNPKIGQPLKRSHFRVSLIVNQVTTIYSYQFKHHLFIVWMPPNQKYIHPHPPNEYSKIHTKYNVMFKDFQCVISPGLAMCNQYITSYCTCLKIAFVVAVSCELWVTHQFPIHLGQSNAMLSCLFYSICIHTHVWKGTENTVLHILLEVNRTFLM